MMEQKLWVESWRPKTIEDCILPLKTKEIFKGFVSNNQIPNLLLYGKQGTGKTSLAKALIKELNAESLFIDASSENGKSMLEELVVPFVSTVSIQNPNTPKIVLLDECDGLTTQAQKSFRPVIELYNKSARFIFTCNFPEKILDPIKSRCSCFNFNIDKKDKDDIIKQFFFRCIKILETNQVEYDKKILISYIIKMFPDFRRIINELQSYSSGFNKIDEGIMNHHLQEDLGTELYTLLKTKNYDKCRQFLAENTFSPEDIFSALYNQIHSNLPKEVQPQVIVTLAQYQMWSSQVMNQNINLLACFIEIMSAL